MATPRYPLLLMFLPYLLGRVTAQSLQKMDEAKLLLRIKNAWGDPPMLAAWDASTVSAHCGWPYILCDAAGRIGRLYLAGINVSGPFPDDVCGLTHLVQ
jgi:kinase